MKIRIFLFITFLFVLTFLVIDNVWADGVYEILTKAKHVSQDLTTVKVKTKSVTASINIAYSEGAMDYKKNEFFITERTDSTELRSTYIKDGSTYMHDGIFDEWVKLNEPLDFFAKSFDRNRWFSAYPYLAQRLGLKIELLEPEVVGQRKCFVVRSQVIDKEKAKFYIGKFLDRFFSPTLIGMLKSDPELLSDFLDTYSDSFETTLWIEKDTFFVVKISNNYYQMPGEGEAISISDESIFYDFNGPVTIEIPEGAKEATVADIGDLAPFF